MGRSLLKVSFAKSNNERVDDGLELVLGVRPLLFGGIDDEEDRGVSLGGQGGQAVGRLGPVGGKDLVVVVRPAVNLLRRGREDLLLLHIRPRDVGAERTDQPFRGADLLQGRVRLANQPLQGADNDLPEPSKSQHGTHQCTTVS